MSSYYDEGKLLMRPAEGEDIKTGVCSDYLYKVPTVYLYGCEDEYLDHGAFSWHEDSVVLVRDNKLLKYTLNHHTELLAKNEKGEIVWMDGRNAPYADCWDGTYLDEYRAAFEYAVEEYDLKKFEKKKYKVVLDSTSKINYEDYYVLRNFVELKTLKIADEDKFIINDGELTLYRGFDENLVIPDGVKSIKVDALKTSIFPQFDNVKLPRTLTNIPVHTLTNDMVKKIEVADGNPRYYTENGMLIDKETKTLLLAFSGDTIPADGSVVRLSNYAFEGRKDIKKITIPPTVIEIGERCFTHCSALEEIDLPDSIKEVGNGCFCECVALKKVKLPSALLDLPYELFYGCKELEGIEFAVGLRKIGARAFARCEKLIAISLPGTLVEIEDQSFDGTGLEKLSVPNSVKLIGDNAFAYCKNLSEINIPEDLCADGKRIFGGKLIKNTDDTYFVQSSIDAIHEAISNGELPF